jgi:hypothetical protein
VRKPTTLSFLFSLENPPLFQRHWLQVESAGFGDGGALTLAVGPVNFDAACQI